MPLVPLVAGIALASVGVQTRAGPADEGPKYEQILLDVLYDRLRVGNSINVLVDTNSRRFIHLKSFANALGFRLNISPARRRAAGFLSDPDDTFWIDGRAARWTHKRQNVKFDRSLCLIHEGELYVEAGVLAQATDIHLLWQFNRSELQVASDRILPVRRQWMQQQALDRNGPADPKQELPSVPTPYSLATFPLLDVRWYTDASFKDRTAESASRLQIEGRGDLLFMDARYRFVSGSGSQSPATLITLGRQDPGGGLLGPLHATQFSFGDVTLAQLPLFARTRSGLGITISNLPVTGALANRASVSGEAPAGSLVEIYRGANLAATVRADAQGRYELPDLRLEAGPNAVRIVTITPDGEVRDERRTLYGNTSGPAVGESQYRITAARVGDSIFPNSLEGISGEQKRFELVGEYRMGLSTSAWFSATAAQIDGRQTFAGFGLNSWIGTDIWRLQGMFSGDRGTALSAGFSRSLRGSNLTVDHTFASRGFGSGLASDIGWDATSISRIRLDGISKQSGRPVAYGMSLDRVDGSNPTTIIRARVGGGDGRTYVSNSTALRLSREPIAGTGLLQVRRSFGQTTGRLDIGYGFGSESTLQNINLSLDRRIAQGYRMRFGLEYDTSNPSRLDSTGTLYRLLGPFELGLNFELDSRGGIRAGLLLAVGLEAEDALRSGPFTRSGSIGTGSVAVRVYLDRDLDGKYSQGDMLLPNVGLRIGGRANAGKSSRYGVSTVDRLTAGQEVAVTLDENTFEDPCWAPATAGILVTPRAGRVTQADLGIIEAAEVEGRAEGLSSSGLTAELVDGAGKVVHTSILDADGGYVFSRVRPGNYTLRLVDSEGLQRASRVVRVGPGATIKDCNLSVG